MISKIYRILLGSASAQALNFVALIIASKGLTPSHFGILSALIASHVFFTQICDFGFNIAFVRNRVAAVVDVQFWNMVLIKIFAMLFFLGLAYFLSKDILIYFDLNGDFENLFLLIIVFVPVSVFYYSVVAFLQARELYTDASIYSLLVSLQRVLLFLIPTFLFVGSIEFYLFGYLVSFLGPVCYFLYRTCNSSLRFRFSKIYLLRLTRIGRWTLLSTVLVTFTSYFGILQISKYSSKEILGVYSIANAFAQVIPLVANSIYLVFLNESGRRSERITDLYLNGKFKIFSIAVFFAGIFIVFLSVLPFHVLYPEYYYLVWVNFALILIAYLFGLLASPLSLILLNNKSAWVLFCVNLLQMLIVVFLGESIFFFSPKFGAGLILLLGNAVGLIIILLFVNGNIKDENRADYRI